MVGQPTVQDVQRWSGELAVVADRIGQHFARSEPHQRAIAHVRGLLSDAEYVTRSLFALAVVAALRAEEAKRSRQTKPAGRKKG